MFLHRVALDRVIGLHHRQRRIQPRRAVDDDAFGRRPRLARSSRSAASLLSLAKNAAHVVDRRHHILPSSGTPSATRSEIDVAPRIAWRRIPTVISTPIGGPTGGPTRPLQDRLPDRLAPDPDREPRQGVVAKGASKAIGRNSLAANARRL